MLSRRIHLALAALVTVTGAHIGQDPPLQGPYKVEKTTVRVPGLYFDDDTVDVWYASNATKPLSFISFAHGAGGGLAILPAVYHSILTSLAGWGYVVAAHRSCEVGTCISSGYYKQAQKVIDWAKAEAAKGHPVMSLANFSRGVGVTGHSMGGESTLRNSQAPEYQHHGIIAAVMLHPYIYNKGSTPPEIPFLAFTGDADTTAPMAMSEKFYDAADAGLPRGLVEKVGATHQEPSDYEDKKEPYNPYMAQFVAGWFKLYLDGETKSEGVDWDDLIFGSGGNSLCGGGDGDMKRCETKRGNGTRFW